jgi:hypothetical protein
VFLRERERIYDKSLKWCFFFCFEIVCKIWERQRQK